MVGGTGKRWRGTCLLRTPISSRKLRRSVLMLRPLLFCKDEAEWFSCQVSASPCTSLTRFNNKLESVLRRTPLSSPKQLHPTGTAARYPAAQTPSCCPAAHPASPPT